MSELVVIVLPAWLVFMFSGLLLATFIANAFLAYYKAKIAKLLEAKS